jgi:glutamate/aspartate transport system permease protein
VNGDLALGVLTTQPYLDWLVFGTLLTLAISALALLIALPLGTVAGVLTTLQNPVARLGARLFIELFRNVPLLVQIFIWYFVLPECLPREWGRWLKRDLPFPEFWSAVVGLGFYTAARIAEQMRAGIQSLAKGLYPAALALGVSPFQAYRYILVPLSLRMILSPLTSEVITIVKNSSLASAIGVLELTEQGRQIDSYTFRGFEAFGAVTLIYLLIAVLLAGFMGLIARKLRIPGLFGTKT